MGSKVEPAQNERFEGGTGGKPLGDLLAFPARAVEVVRDDAPKQLFFVTERPIKAGPAESGRFDQVLHGSGVVAARPKRAQGPAEHFRFIEFAGAGHPVKLELTEPSVHRQFCTARERGLET